MPDKKIKPHLPDPKKKIKEEKEETKYECKLSMLKILVNSVILETVGSVREAYSANESIRLEMDTVLIDNIEDVLKKIEEFIPLCDRFMKFIDIDKLEQTIIDLEDLDVTRSSSYAEGIWNVFAPALLSV